MPTTISWSPPADWSVITTIDAHTAGEPLRVITGGLPPIPGDTILAKRRFMKDRLDFLRRALMWEPRGHADMYGAIVTEPVTPDGDIGVLFLHNEGFSTMCGHGVIALATVLVETGRIPAPSATTEIRMDTPAGRVTATVHRVDGRVDRVSFRNVPSFVLAPDQVVTVPGLGDIRCDIAFGGAFYAFVRAADAGVGLAETDFRQLIDIGMTIKRAVMDSVPIVHPVEEDLGFLYGTIFTGPPADPAHHSRNVCIFADGEVDRSPTGTGVSARAALHHARGDIALNDTITIESILGTCMSVRALEETRFGPHPAVIPEVSGQAFLTGHAEWWLDPHDPLRHGFILR